MLLKIAYNESNFNSKVKNPKSTASGLFGFLNSTKQKYGYGDTIAEQVAGASKLYDANAKQLQSWISKYGTNGKTYG
ncbi:transglycosylase SLT domain-containing protein [uncultured Leptotrichia sp.]|uniref:transglycosylase SLT domain-containing protein n=1 Tax=uncultured Leptotrichia sp. TaxID=159271 RepID=UPI003454DDF9